MIPVPRRSPWAVACACKVSEDNRSLDEDRSYYVLRSIDERSSDYFNIVICKTRPFNDNGSDILEDVDSENRLDKEYVVEALICFINTQVIDIAVTVKVKVGDRIGRAVEQRLEFPYRIGLCEKGSNSLKVQIKGHIFSDIVNLCDCGGDACLDRSNRRAVVGG